MNKGGTVPTMNDTIDLQITIPPLKIPPERCRLPGCTADATFIAVDEPCDAHTYACVAHLGSLLTDDVSWGVASLALVDRQMPATGFRTKRLAGVHGQ